MELDWPRAVKVGSQCQVEAAKPGMKFTRKPGDKDTESEDRLRNDNFLDKTVKETDINQKRRNGLKR